MNVKELIEELQAVEDKTLPVLCNDDTGMVGEVEEVILRIGKYAYIF